MTPTGHGWWHDGHQLHILIGTGVIGADLVCPLAGQDTPNGPCRQDEEHRIDPAAGCSVGLAWEEMGSETLWLPDGEAGFHPAGPLIPVAWQSAGRDYEFWIRPLSTQDRPPAGPAEPPVVRDQIAIDEVPA